MVQIIFLGTAGDEYVTGRQERASGGIIIKDKEHQLHVDPGPGSLIRAKEYGINVRENNAIIVTSPSIIRSNDMNVLILAMTYGGLEKHARLLVHEDLYDTENSFYKYLKKTISIRPGSKEYIRNKELLFYKTTSKALGMKIIMGKVIGYTADTGYSEELSRNLEGSEVLILNCNAKDSISYLKRVRPKLAITNHYTLKCRKGIAKQVQSSTGIKTVDSEDGMRLDLEEKGQRRLGNY